MIVESNYISILTQNLPAHWRFYRIGSIFVERTEKVSDEDYTPLSVTMKGVVPQLENVAKTTNGENRKGVCINDFVINSRSDRKGSGGMSKYDGSVSLINTVLKPNTKYDNRYTNYLLTNVLFQEEFYKFGKGIVDDMWSTKYFDMKYIKVPCPPIEEQITIANYLDKQSERTKHFIQKKQAFIELLKEQRQAIISRAVTKGINPDVTLKDSGIEWLGDIPEHWELRKLRYCGQCQNGLNKGGEFFGKGFPFFGYGDIYNNEILPEIPSGLVESTGEDQANCSVEKGDVFFTRTSEIVDEIAIASTCHETIPNATFSGFLIRFRPTANLLYEGYSTYYFRNELLREYFVKEMNIITRASMSQDLLKSLPIVLPPIEEQVIIYKYIKAETTKIDQAIAKAEKEIELIKEYREAMIAEAVLGKLHHKIMNNRSEIPNSSEEPMPLLTN